MDERAAFLFDVADSQERVLMVLAGAVWEGHVESCVAGTVVATVRLAGTRDEYVRRELALAEIRGMARAESEESPNLANDLEPDPLLESARELVQRAREYEHMSLAERVLYERSHRA